MTSAMLTVEPVAFGVDRAAEHRGRFSKPWRINQARNGTQGPMYVRLVALMASLSFSGCLCSAPPSGECTGTWGGQTFDKAVVDPSSTVVIVNKKTCAETTQLKRYDVSWGGSKVGFKLTFTSGGPTILGGTTTAVPPPVGPFLTFSVTPEVPSPTGELKLGIKGLGRRTGTLTLSNATESLSCSFDMDYQTEGARISCGGSSDFD